VQDFSASLEISLPVHSAMDLLKQKVTEMLDNFKSLEMMWAVKPRTSVVVWIR
jgi:hypothetical protein